MENYWLRFDGAGGEAYIAQGLHISPGLSDFSYCVWYKSVGSSPFCTYKLPCLNNVGVRAGLTLEYPYLKANLGNTVNADAAELSYDNKYFIAMTCDRDSATGLKVYVNGVLVLTADPTSAAAMNLSYPGNQLFLYSGCGDYIDQVRFYKGVILTQSQITGIYNAGMGIEIDEAAFAAICGANTGWYSEFDNGTGMTFSGRYWNGSVWSDSDGTFEGNVAYELGGAPWDCKIYRGQDGIIDYENSVALMSSSDSQVSIPNQVLPPDTIWYYIRRQVAPCGLESPDSPACIIRIDADGDMLPTTPNQPLSVTAIQFAGGKFLLRWRYTPIDHEIVPTGFHVYVDSGSGFNFAVPAATVNYKLGGHGEFKWESGAYSHGQRIKFCVRAYAQGKGETQNTDYVAAVADALGPESITDVYATVEQLS